MKNIDTMKTIDIITLILIIIGGVNWGLVGLADIDLVSAIFWGGSGGDCAFFNILAYCLRSGWPVCSLAACAFEPHVF